MKDGGLAAMLELAVIHVYRRAPSYLPGHGAGESPDSALVTVDELSNWFLNRHRSGLEMKGDDTMNMDILQGKWGEISGEIKKQWGRLTDDDLLKIEGQRDKLEGSLRKRYGFSRKAAEAEVDQFLEDAEDRMNSLRYLLRRRVSEAQERAQDTAETVRETAGKRAEDVNEQMSSNLPEDVVYVVEEYPWLVVIGVLVAGVLIGLLLGPKR
jgi:uncharacterized protein YjbJ (UPF0337 family)